MPGLGGAGPTTGSGGWVTDLFTVSDQQTVIDSLRWKAEVLEVDASSAIGVRECYVDLDVWTAVATPVAGPTTTQTTTDRPDLTGYTTALNDGAPSAGYLAQCRLFTQTDANAAGFDPEDDADQAVWTFEEQLSFPSLDSSNPDTFTPTTSDPNLTNSEDYRVYVRYGKRNVAGETLWSAWDTGDFSVSLTQPTAPTVSVFDDTALGGAMRVVVTTSTITHDTVDSVEVQASYDGGTTWSTIRNGINTDVAASTAYTFRDWDAPRGVALQYRARVTEGLTASSTQIASDWTTDTSETWDNDNGIWIGDVPDFSNVATDVAVLIRRTINRPEQAGTFWPLGRSTQVVVTATTSRPETGQFVVSDDDGNIQTLLDAAPGTWLVKWRSDNEQTYLRVVNATATRTEVGSSKITEWTLDYVEVDSGI